LLRLWRFKVGLSMVHGGDSDFGRSVISVSCGGANVCEFVC